MNRTLLLLLFAVRLGAIDGVVTNGTTGKPQAGATVTLYKLGGGGLESVESVKSDPAGKFVIQSNLQGPRLLQSAWDGVTYNHMLPPGAPTTNVALSVYSATKSPGKARVAQHMILLEPAQGQIAVSESFVFENNGTTTHNDPDGGTLVFYLPPAAKGSVQINATAPQGVPIRRAADKTGKPDVYKVDFPIKPGESRIDLSYSVPMESPAKFAGKLLYNGGEARIIAPSGVTLKGAALEDLGREPRTQAAIYGIKEREYSVEVEGSGTLRRSEPEGDENSGPSIQQILPRVYDRMAWILAIALTVLALGFVLLLRRGAGLEAPRAAAAPAARKKK